MRRLLCVLFLALFSAACCWAQESSLPSIEFNPATSGLPLQTQGGSWSSFDLILQQLEQTLIEQQAESKRLESSLSEARLLSQQQSIALRESATQIAELCSSLERCEDALKASERLLKEVQALSQRQGLELWLWRGGCAALAILSIVALLR